MKHWMINSILHLIFLSNKGGTGKNFNHNKPFWYIHIKNLAWIVFPTISENFQCAKSLDVACYSKVIQHHRRLFQRISQNFQRNNFHGKLWLAVSVNSYHCFVLSLLKLKDSNFSRKHHIIRIEGKMLHRVYLHKILLKKIHSSCASF